MCLEGMKYPTNRNKMVTQERVVMQARMHTHAHARAHTRTHTHTTLLSYKAIVLRIMFIHLYAERIGEYFHV